MRVAFLTQDLQLSGGVGVVLEHSTQLARRGFEVDIVLTRSSAAPDWSYRDLEHLHALPLDVARGRRYDVALATWWETAQQLFELDADRHAWFVQSLEDRFYDPGDPRRLAVALLLDMPVRFVTEARWIATTLEALHPGEKVFQVRNGVAKDVFPVVEGVPERSGPLRVLVEGSARVPFKGVAEALRATGLMREARHVTLLTPDGSGAGVRGADRAVGPLPQAALADLYAEHDVLLKLSRVEGMSGPPLEAFHRGATCVTTPVTGHDEYVVHGENALVVDWDDPAGTARALDLLARDRALLARLRAAALETARAWPSWERQGEEMAAALRALHAEPAPTARERGRGLARDAAAVLSDTERLSMELAAARQVAARASASRAYRLAVKSRSAIEKPGRAYRKWQRRRRGQE